MLVGSIVGPASRPGVANTAVRGRNESPPPFGAHVLGESAPKPARPSNCPLPVAPNDNAGARTTSSRGSPCGGRSKAIDSFSARPILRSAEAAAPPPWPFAVPGRRTPSLAYQFTRFLPSLQMSGPRPQAAARSTRRKVERLPEDKDCVGLVRFAFAPSRGGTRFKWARDNKAIRERAKTDGKYVLVTTLDKSPTEVLELYRTRDRLERAFRLTKGTLQIRPIWSRNKERILAHVFICFLTCLLGSILQMILREEKPELTEIRALKRLVRIRNKVERSVSVKEERQDPELLKRLLRAGS